MFKRADFIVTAFTKIEYIGSDYTFERPKNLTKWDIACVLDNLRFCQVPWLHYYDAYSKRDLIQQFQWAFESL